MSVQFLPRLGLWLYCSQSPSCARSFCTFANQLPPMRLVTRPLSLLSAWIVTLQTLGAFLLLIGFYQRSWAAPSKEAAAPLPGAAFGTPLNPEDLDAVSYAQWSDGAE